MNCPNCGCKIGKRNKCDKCGTDISLIQKAIRYSNYYYNMGLERANVRDLSGAVLLLQKSLRFYKENTNARNLLGLVYYEMGEMVSALSAWVLSKHFQPNDNDCDYYINCIQSNQTRLEATNQAIKKYNVALQYAKQGSDDLAIIQLKKVVSQNPKFLRANHLLALLYMKNNEKEKAYKILTRIKKIDVTNTITLRYLSELSTDKELEKARETGHKTTHTTSKVYHGEVNTITPISSYHEDKPNIWQYINLIIGIIIGVGLLYFLVVPNVKKQTAAEYNAKIVDLNSKIAVQNKESQSFENDKKELQDQIDTLTKELETANAKAEKNDAALYDDLFAAVKSYVAGESKDKIVQAILKIDATKIQRPAAKEVLDTLRNKTFADAAESIYEEGHTLYSKRKYEDAIKVLEQVVSMNEEKVEDALYFIGRSYQMMSDNENALTYYDRIIKEFPDSSRAAQAKGKKNEIK